MSTPTSSFSDLDLPNKIDGSISFPGLAAAALSAIAAFAGIRGIYAWYSGTCPFRMNVVPHDKQFAGSKFLCYFLQFGLVAAAARLGYKQMSP